MNHPSTQVERAAMQSESQQTNSPSKEENGYHSFPIYKVPRIPIYPSKAFGAFRTTRGSNGCSDLIWLFLRASSLRSFSSLPSFLYFSMTFSICTWLPAGTLYGEPTFMILVLVSCGVTIHLIMPSSTASVAPKSCRGESDRCTYSGNLISTYSCGLVLTNSTRSSPACSIMRVRRSFCADHLSFRPSVAPPINRVKYGRVLSLLLREM